MLIWLKKLEPSNDFWKLDCERLVNLEAIYEIIYVGVKISVACKYATKFV